MSKESNLAVVTQFVQTWTTTPDRLEEELKSVHNETKRIPDPSIFMVTPEGLVDEKTNKLVRSFIRSDTPLYAREYKALTTLEDWAKSYEEDIAIWVSPPYPGEYPCAKATFSKVGYDWEGNKYLQNTTLLFGDKQTLGLDIIPNCPVTDPEKLRESIFVVDEATVILALKAIEEYGIYSEDNGNINQEIKKYVEDIKAGVAPYLIAEKMQKSGFLGDNPISCPLMGFSNYMVARGGLMTEKFIKNCGNCGASLNKMMKKFDKCPHCGGVYEGC